jgi:hypothetical protein
MPSGHSGHSGHLFSIYHPQQPTTTTTTAGEMIERKGLAGVADWPERGYENTCAIDPRLVLFL